MEMQNRSRALLPSSLSNGFSAFVCGLSTPSLTRLWSVVFGTCIASAIDQILVRSVNFSAEIALMSNCTRFRPTRPRKLGDASTVSPLAIQEFALCKIALIVLGSTENIAATSLRHPLFNFPDALFDNRISKICSHS
ncbi:hypothetical protein Vadar_017706 [Vaccinium darrowii]|uniref:Uncharacterized protein n=1 Tax=Vaccinium darrowii TaxID=229202 RepID=A0ACB7YW97_9ERIC|nr:hypothetical protein Vadar_017706 [Vaccinium darrowii]